DRWCDNSRTRMTGRAEQQTPPLPVGERSARWARRVRGSHRPNQVRSQPPHPDPLPSGEREPALSPRVNHTRRARQLDVRTEQVESQMDIRTSPSESQKSRRVGIVMFGVTGRMGTNQHLERSIAEIRQEGGLDLGDGRLMPDPILVGRNAAKLE